MSINFTIETHDGITSVRFLRPATLKDIRDAIDEYAHQGQGAHHIWDFSCGGDLAADQIIEIARYVESKKPLPLKTAIVAPHDLNYSLARMYEAYFDYEQIEVGVFRSVLSALHWLKDESALEDDATES